MGLELVDSLGLVLVTVISLAFQVFIVVLGVVVAWRWLHRPGGFAATAPRPREKNAVEILNERYARGEIDAQEYEERRERLLGRSG